MLQNVCTDTLDDIVNEYNNTYKTIKIKPLDVNSRAYIDLGIKNNDKDPKFKVGDQVRTAKYKNSFARGYDSNCSKQDCAIKITAPWTYVTNDLNGEEIVGAFYKKKIQKTNQTKHRIEKVIKIIGGELYVKGKGYDDAFNSWIDKKDIVIQNELFSRIFYQ